MDYCMKKGWKRRLLLTVNALLLTVCLTGCGTQDTPARLQEISAETGNPTGGSNDGAVEKGAYLEKEQPLTGIPENVTVKQLFTVDDKVHLVTAYEEGEGTKLQEWELQEDGFAEVTRQWLSDFELPCEAWVDVTLTQDGNGVQYLFCNLVDEESEGYRGRLWRSDGDAVKEITPEKWTVPNEQWGVYEYIKGVAALENGTLAAVSWTSADRLYGEDGSVLDSRELSGSYEEDIVTDGENVFLFSQGTSGSIEGVEKWIGGDSNNAVMIPFAQSSSNGVLLCALPDGTLISAGTEGIFQCASGTEDWKRLIAGMETSFSLSTSWCTDLTALQDGRIYALFHEEGNKTKLLVYEYDPDAVPVVSTVLKLYAVEESSFLQNAAALYHKEHPEVLIELQYGYTLNEKYSGETLNYTEIYQQINTMLMGSDAPDILVLDHLEQDSYIEKGVLADIQDIVAPLEESGELLSNITGAYRGEDGKRYIVPMQFGFYLALGRDISAQDMTSIKNLAAFLDSKEESYMGSRTTGELVDEFYPYFCEAMVENKELNREVLSEYLSALKQIANNCGMIEKRSENDRAYDKWDLAYRAKLAITESNGFNGSMFPMAMADYIKGDFAGFENAFIPYIEMGISAESQYQDIAADFLTFCLSEEVQGTDYYSGYPINAGCLEMLAAVDRSDIEACTSIEIGDGVSDMFYINDYSQETAQRLLAVCKQLDHPVKEDAKIREVLVDTLPLYLQGTQSLEDTLDKIEGGLRMYLAE